MSCLSQAGDPGFLPLLPFAPHSFFFPFLLADGSMCEAPGDPGGSCGPFAGVFGGHYQKY